VFTLNDQARIENFTFAKLFAGGRTFAKGRKNFLQGMKELLRGVKKFRGEEELFEGMKKNSLEE
jgi:hypothetical protein